MTDSPRNRNFGINYRLYLACGVRPRPLAAGVRAFADYRDSVPEIQRILFERVGRVSDTRLVWMGQPVFRCEDLDPDDIVPV